VPQDLTEAGSPAKAVRLARVAGTGWVDGVQALRLKPAQASSSATGPLPTTAVFWVDASTYLPARGVVTVSFHGTIQDDFQWLRPTPANLDVPVPPGFTQVRPAPAMRRQVATSGAW
jgi:hypothetical protein